MAGYLAGEAGNGAGDLQGFGQLKGRCKGEGERTLVDLAEDDDPREFGF